MATNQVFDWRQSDRRLFAAIAIVFPLIVLIGFGRTYYLKFAFENPPQQSLLVHLHGLIMTAWVFYFIAQTWLIRSRKPKVHMRAGWIGVGLGTVLIIVGFFTAAAAAKYGSPSTPAGIPPLAFAIVPIFDLLVFAILFGVAIYYRKRPADHKRLMLLTVLNFLPPALARIPIAGLQNLGPLVFFGVPAVLAIGLLIYDTRQNGKLNRVFLAGTLLLLISYPLRLALMGTEAWMAFAAWFTSWAA